MIISLTIMTVALGSLGMSISLPTGPVIFTSAPGFRSPAFSELLCYLVEEIYIYPELYCLSL